ncbi:hypothetical protein IWX88_001452 [Frigoribacterium sp. CG_9.8]|nr:hypothetical protein [Frigoribacterium sp. CG_9.8]
MESCFTALLHTTMVVAKIAAIDPSTMTRSGFAAYEPSRIQLSQMQAESRTCRSTVGDERSKLSKLH